eukprot:363811_1
MSSIIFQLLVVINIILQIITTESYSPFAYSNSTTLKWFKKAKLGMFIHYSPVTQWGDDLSWPVVCPKLPCTVQAENHTRITINTIDELKQHRLNYFNLYKTFNPYLFNASNWVSLAKNNGFKYIVYTAIHCAGFASWNTKLTDYTIMNTPFGRDLYGELVTEARKQGLKIGAYICPSLWLNNSYWAPDAMTALVQGCHPSYSPPENATTQKWWNTFVSYLHSLSIEIATNYAPDLYWYDCANSGSWADTHLDVILPTLQQSNSEGVLVMTRGGIFSDYVETGDKQEGQTINIVGTPQEFAGDYFEIPATIQASGQWTYDPTTPSRNTTSMIFDIILLTSKGGNYLLDISPMADGTIAKQQITSLEEIGSWMNMNGQAIYNTMPLYPHQWGNNMFVTTSDDDSNHVIYILNTPPLAKGSLYVPWIRQNLLNDKLNGISILGKGDTTFNITTSGLYIDVPTLPPNPFQYAVVYKLMFV